MKKILLVLAAMFCVATVSAQQKFTLGGRLGSGLQADAEWFYSTDKYVEARFGMSWMGGISADFTALHNWNCCNWNWTPKFATWYLDAGVGANLGGRPIDGVSYLYVGVAGQVKFGMQFKKVPLRLAIDYTPVFGAEMLSYKGYTEAGFFGNGLGNFGVSAVYCF